MSQFDGKRPAGRIGPQAVIYIFKSETNEGLNAFAGTAEGRALPAKFAPWTPAGSVLPSRSPPHGLSRAAIQAGIAERGFQLWRRVKKD